MVPRGEIFFVGEDGTIYNAFSAVMRESMNVKLRFCLSVGILLFITSSCIGRENMVLIRKLQMRYAIAVASESRGVDKFIRCLVCWKDF